jgi:dolichol-phosphate mannosyltransferase
LVVVIATYNEIENLPRLMDQVFQYLPQAKIRVIDDNSPDGTGRWVDDNVKRFPSGSLSCEHRSGKLGLGSATITGFGWAMEQKVPLVATMDADFSHDPASLPALVKAIRNEADSSVAVAIGSRYVVGGAIEGWPLFRRFASKAVNLFARTWLGLPTKDNSGAFRVYRTAALESIGLGSIRSGSYSYLEEVLFRLMNAGYSFVEVPITFRDRDAGVTKTNWRLGVKVFWEILHMRSRRVRERG